jgi:N-acetyl-anhydromuramyl-L-alanine amidase AmpD
MTDQEVHALLISTIENHNSKIIPVAGSPACLRSIIGMGRFPASSEVSQVIGTTNWAIQIGRADHATDEDDTYHIWKESWAEAMIVRKKVVDHKIINIVDQLPHHPTATYQTRQLSDITHIAIHHSAGSGNASPADIARFHVNTREWPGIAYHFLIQPDGTIYQTQRLKTISWHVANNNKKLIGICLNGNFITIPPQQKQLDATKWLVAQLRNQFPNIEIKGHKDFPDQQTACPGDSYHQWLSYVATTDTSPKTATVYDIADYVIGDPTVQIELRRKDGSQERIQYQRDSNDINTFYLVKGENVGCYETIRVTDDFIRRGTDTSEGEDRYYTISQDGQPDSTWCPRRMSIGESWVGNSHTVTHRWKGDGSIRLAGTWINRCVLNAHYEQFQGYNGVIVPDVIELVGVDEHQQPLERFFFARGIGMVGWSSDWGESKISEIHTPGTRADIHREVIQWS